MVEGREVADAGVALLLGEEDAGLELAKLVSEGLRQRREVR
jgi:hypothetical protein